MISPPTGKILRLLIVLMLVVFSFAWAEETEETELDDVVVTAERSPIDWADAARSIDVVTAQQIDERMSRTVPESLRMVSGVLVQRTNQGGGAPFIRGLVGNQVLILVDGIRLNNSTFRGGPNQYLNTIDPFFIDRIEVMRGPGSVLYGSDALGGTINVVTRRRENYAPDFGVNGRLMNRFTTAEREVTTHGDAQMNVGRLFGATFSGNFRQFGNIDPGGSYAMQGPYGYEEQNFAGNFDFNFGNHWIWQFSAQHVNLDEVPNYDPDNPKNVFEPQRRNLYYTRLLAYDLSPYLDTISLTGSYHRQMEGRQKIKADALDEETRDLDIVDTIGANLQLETPIGDFVRFVYGGEYYHDAISSERHIHDVNTGDRTEVDPQFTDGSSFTSAAGYLEMRLTPWRWFKLVPGVRYSTFAPDAEVDDPELGDVAVDDAINDFTWAAHALFKPHDHHGIILGASRGFRVPSIDDLTKLGSEDGRYDIPNSDLGPETMIQYELGYRLSHPRVRGSLFGYYSQIEDLITRKPATYNGQEQIGEDIVNRNENVGEAYIYGGEVGLHGTIVRRYLDGGVIGSYTFGHNDTDDEPMRRIPPPLYSAYLRAYWPSQHAWFEVASEGAARQDRLSEGDESDSRIGPDGTDRFAVLHLRSGFAAGEHFEINMAVENVTDEPYKFHGSGPWEAGRNFKAQLSFVF